MLKKGGLRLEFVTFIKIDHTSNHAFCISGHNNIEGKITEC